MLHSFHDVYGSQEGGKAVKKQIRTALLVQGGGGAAEQAASLEVVVEPPFTLHCQSMPPRVQKINAFQPETSKFLAVSALSRNCRGAFLLPYSFSRSGYSYPGPSPGSGPRQGLCALLFVPFQPPLLQVSMVHAAEVAAGMPIVVKLTLQSHSALLQPWKLF
ncbi:hypothetical protein ABBQ38_011526 [Trebouxia sp. C0009 RCD-2024]